jgi:hypothetical protein
MMTPNKNHILSLPDISTGLLLKACTTTTQNQQTPHIKEIAGQISTTTI